MRRANAAEDVLIGANSIGRVLQLHAGFFVQMIDGGNGKDNIKMVFCVSVYC